MKKFFIMLAAVAAFFSSAHVQEVLADEGNHPQIDEQKNRMSQPAAGKPESSAKASVKQTIEITKELTVDATAYTANCKGCSGTTFMGVDLKENPHEKVIAVDPEIIPLGSRVFVQGYGFATAADVGGEIEGKEIDVFLPKKEDAVKWGRKKLTVKVIEYK